GHWGWGAVVALVRGRPGPLSFDDVTITDPDGTEVLHIDHVSFALEVHREPTRVFIRDLVIKDARWRFGTMTSAKKIGFLSAFEGVPHAARKPAAKKAAAELSIEGARLEGVQATFDLPTWGLVLRDVHAMAGMAFKGKTFTFEVK